MSDDIRQKAITAAETAITAIRRNQAIDTQTLAHMARALGEDTDFLERRDKSGFLPAIPSRKQRRRAISFLEDLIDDLQIELATA